jgi:hypothetical protein
VTAGDHFARACCATLALAAVTACGGAPPAPPVGEPGAYEEVVLGELALRDGDATAAAEHFAAALALDPGDEYLKERCASALAAAEEK